MMDGGKRIPATAPTAIPVQAPCGGRLLGLVDADIVLIPFDPRSIEGTHQSGCVEVEDRLVIDLSIADVVIDAGVEENGSVGHRGPFQLLLQA